MSDAALHTLVLARAQHYSSQRFEALRVDVLGLNLAPDVQSDAAR